MKERRRKNGEKSGVGGKGRGEWGWEEIGSEGEADRKEASNSRAQSETIGSFVLQFRAL